MVVSLCGTANVLCFFKAFNSHLVVCDRENTTVCEQQDWSTEVLSSEKCCTVMHEAIVTQLHPQDQCFLPCSAVPLHQKIQGRENIKRFHQRVHGVNVSKGRKQKWMKQQKRTKDIVCLKSS